MGFDIEEFVLIMRSISAVSFPNFKCLF